MLPKVAASEMMNSHMVSFLDGMAKGDGSNAWPCPCTAISDSLTVFLPPSRLKPYGNDQEQVDPQNAHEMPVDGGIRKRAHSQSDMPWSQTSGQAHKAGDPAENMQGMHRGKYIQEGTVGTCRQIESLRGEFTPNHILPRDEGEAEHQRDSKPAQGIAGCAIIHWRGVQERAAGHFQRDAAQEQDGGIH